MKNFWSHVHWWSPQRRKNVKERHLASLNLRFLRIAIDGTVFAEWKKKGGSTKRCFKSLFFAWGLRGRRKSSQKLAKRRAFIWEGGGLDRFRKASFKKKKWAARGLRAPLGLLQIDSNSIERRTLRKGAADKAIECLVKEGNMRYKEKPVVEEFLRRCGWYLSLFDADQSWNRKLADYGLTLCSAPAVPRPRDSRTSQAEATSIAVVLPDQATSDLSFSVPALPVVQSDRRHCEIRSMRQ